MDFPNAFMLLRSGAKITRSSWKNSDDYTRYVAIAYADVKTIEDTHMVEMEGTGKYAYLFSCFTDGNYVHTDRWHPSVEDLFAVDWEMVD